MASRTIACIEVGGSSVQTVVFAGAELSVIAEGVQVSDADVVLMAVPGVIADGRVVAASNLGWYDVDPARALGLARPAALVLNDAEAAALGEAALRGVDDLTFLGLGTGIGGAVVRSGRVVATNLLGHAPGFSERECVCGNMGCLETVAAGWALPDPLPQSGIEPLAVALAEAIGREPLMASELVVVTGGLARRHPAIVAALAALLPERRVEPTAAPRDAKSAAAWGLARAARSLHPALP